MKQQFTINGMHCDHCVAKVETAVKDLPGIEKVKINLKKGSGKVKFDESAVSAEQITAAITAAGFAAEVE